MDDENQTLLNSTASPFFEPKTFNREVISYMSIPCTLGVILGSLGNTLVFLLVCLSPDMKRPIYLLIGNLAVADWLITSICLPLFATHYAFYWPAYPYPQWVCKMLAYLVHSSGSASVYTLLAITYNRFIAICYPFKRHLHMNRRKTLYTIAVIWAVSLASTLPSPIIHVVGDTGALGGQMKKCYEAWNSKASESAYLLYRVLSFVVFVIIILILYLQIGRTILRSKIPGQSTQSSINSEKMRSKSNRKVIKMMLVICIFFVICWLPYMLNKLLIVINKPGYSAPEPFIVAGNFFAIMNSVINPYLYLITQKFRVGLTKILTCRLSDHMNYSISSTRHRKTSPPAAPNPGTLNLRPQERNAGIL